MFDYFVSLGMSCPTAASMSKYGLRAFSGPFDWLITEDFSQILYFIESDFDGFLQPENLELNTNGEQGFIDKSCGFIFLHERDADYFEVKEKYNRRISRFIELSQNKTCFLRSITSAHELEYIKNHVQYIQNTIKKRNKESEIVFLLKNDLRMPDGLPFRYYYMPGVYGGRSRQLLRSWFDGATDFLEFCGNNYSGCSILKNIAIDRANEEHPLVLAERRYHTLTTLLSHDFSKNILPERTAIYGAGMLGKQLCTRIRDLTQIECFIDRSKGGLEFHGIPIVALRDLTDVHGATIIVSTSYDFEAIRENMREHLGSDVPVISIDEILGLKFS